MEERETGTFSYDDMVTVEFTYKGRVISSQGYDATSKYDISADGTKLYLGGTEVDLSVPSGYKISSFVGAEGKVGPGAKITAVLTSISGDDDDDNDEDETGDNDDDVIVVAFAVGAVAVALILVLAVWKKQ